MQLEDQPGIGAGVVVEARAMQRYPGFALVCAQAAQLDRERVLTPQRHARDMTVQQRGIAGLQQVAERSPQHLSFVVAQQRIQGLIGLHHRTLE